MMTVRVVALAALALSGLSLNAADISGGWTGGFYGGPVWLTFQQEGTRLTGTAGPTEKQQFLKFDSGKVEDDRVTFALGPMQFDLQIKGGTIVGEVRNSQENPPVAFPVSLRRVGATGKTLSEQEAAALTFEVASVKAAPTAQGPNKGRGGDIRPSKGQILMDGVTLWKCIAFTYGISDENDYAIVGPSWLKSERYNIIAKVPPNSYWEQVQAMMQNLLAERFKLVLHREAKELSVYAMVPAKGGVKLHEVAFGKGGMNFSQGQIEAKSMPLAALADRLSQMLDHPVLDETGITGVFEFTLKWTPDERPAAPSAGAPGVGVAGDAGPSIFAAMQQQLGLRLEPRKSAVEILVVDRAEKVPVEN
jgi:uncharacterized protein (TIGR03435 family)